MHLNDHTFIAQPSAEHAIATLSHVKILMLYLIATFKISFVQLLN